MPKDMITGHQYDFIVRYRFLSTEEGGRKTLPYQGCNWFLIGGDKLILSRQDKISAIDLFDIHDLRQTDRNKAEILTDPWSRKPAVWELNTDTKEVRMVRLFNDYTDHEYTDNIIW